MPQSLAAKRLIRARLLRSINRRSHLSSANSSTLKNCKFFPVIFIKKVRRWYRQTFKYCDIWYNSMKDIEGRFGSKLAVYFKILRYLVMLNFFVTIFTFRWVWWEIVSSCVLFDVKNFCISLSHCSFIIFPQIIYDGFQADDTSAGNESLSNSFEFVDILTGDVSECFARASALFFWHWTLSENAWNFYEFYTTCCDDDMKSSHSLLFGLWKFFHYIHNFFFRIPLSFGLPHFYC